MGDSSRNVPRPDGAQGECGAADCAQTVKKGSPARGHRTRGTNVGRVRRTRPVGSPRFIGCRSPRARSGARPPPSAAFAERGQRGDPAARAAAACSPDRQVRVRRGSVRPSSAGATGKEQTIGGPRFCLNSGLCRTATGDSHILPGSSNGDIHVLPRVIGSVSCPWLCPVSAAAARLCPALCFPPPGPFGPGYMPRPLARPGLGAEIQACVGGWFRRGAGEMNPVLGRRTARTCRVSATGPVRVAAQRASPDFPRPLRGAGSRLGGRLSGGRGRPFRPGLAPRHAGLISRRALRRASEAPVQSALDSARALWSAQGWTALWIDTGRVFGFPDGPRRPFAHAGIQSGVEPPHSRARVADGPRYPRRASRREAKILARGKAAPGRAGRGPWKADHSLRNRAPTGREENVASDHAATVSRP